MKKLLLCVVGLMATGCMYDVPEFEMIETSETGFLIPLEGDTAAQKKMPSKDVLEQQKVATKRVQITHKWVSTGYLPWSGEYMDTVRLVKVDRKPVTREWTSDPNSGTSNQNQAVKVESADSVDFGIGFTVTAMILEEDTSQFLYNYTSKDLSGVADKEIRNKVQEYASDYCAKFPLDILRGQKGELMAFVRESIIPFFKEKGITITSVGMASGFMYTNQKVQDAIDKTVQDQQLKVSALAEKDAQLVKNETIKLEAEAAAEAAKIKAEGEANAIKAVADAKEYEIQKATQNTETYIELKRLEVDVKRLEKWDGKYPTYFMSNGESPQLLLQTPNIPSPK